MKLVFALSRNQLTSLLACVPTPPKSLGAAPVSFITRLREVGFELSYENKFNNVVSGDAFVSDEDMDRDDPNSYVYPITIEMEVDSRAALRDKAALLDRFRKGNGLYMMRGWKFHRILGDDNKFVPWWQTEVEWLQQASMNDIKNYLKKHKVAAGSKEHNIVSAKARKEVPDGLIRDIAMGKSERALGAAWTSLELQAYKFYTELQVG
jgi:hypothetical protein